MLEIFSKNLYFRGDKLKKIYIDARTSYGRVRISTKLEKTRKNELFVLENIDEFIYGHFNQVAPNVKLTISRVAQEVLKECQNIKRSTLNQIKLLNLCLNAKKQERLMPKGLNQAELKAFSEFIAYRNEKKKITISTHNAIVKKFESLKAQGVDIALAVENSILNGWQGIFTPKVPKLPNQSQCGAQNFNKQKPKDWFEWYSQKKSKELALG